MRVFYIFDMKSEFKALYHGNESALFCILKQLYYLNSEEFVYGYRLFEQLTNKIDKNYIDHLLFLKMHQDIPYSKRDDKHRINNLYKDEISILEVRHAYIKIQAEQEGTSFFDILPTFSKNFFVCDFEMQDYFFLEKGENKEKETMAVSPY